MLVLSRETHGLSDGRVDDVEAVRHRIDAIARATRHQGRRAIEQERITRTETKDAGRRREG